VGLKAINIVLIDEGNGPCFVEIESDEGKSISIGEVVLDYCPDINQDFYAIRITPEDIINAGTD
jgi:hypothetical protein